MLQKCAWETYSEKDLKKLEKLCKEYREFLDHGKTERECVKRIIADCEKEGYLDLNSVIKEGKTLKAGDRSLNMIIRGQSVMMLFIADK